MDLLLFDIDSTLLTDGGASGKAFNAAFEELFFVSPVTVEKHGKTDPMISNDVALATLGRKLTSDEEIKLHNLYAKNLPYYLNCSDSFSLLDGVKNLSRLLADNSGFFMGIQTGNLESCAWEKLSKGGIKEFFKFGGFGSDSSNRIEIVKTAISRGVSKLGTADTVARTYVFGDSPYDIVAGNANGAISIGVTSGKNSESELLAAGASLVIANFSNSERLLSMLPNLRPRA